MSAPFVCVIGTSEPWNAAGLGRDLLTLAECGARGVCVACGVSAQDGAGAFALHEVASDLIEAQFDALGVAPIAAFKVGALASAATIAAVGRRLQAPGVPVVYDPVLATSAGGRFAREDALPAILRDLVPRSTLVTPNAREAGELLGAPVQTVRQMEEAARALVALGAAAALVTGGDLVGDEVTDVLYDGETLVYRQPRVAGGMRGTGCMLSAAIAAALAGGAPLRTAVEGGRAFVRAKLERAVAAGGMRLAD
ncbi:MAG: bifunctional hydroxymethylpyrimidine kinase/phosphomethylpyrimidine kinase [Candidatus Eremiobacteraeota bacterium]|nr:bifunctional hydroxymethylpyrimidine kinase/phosphomethylpyrimidine kinase [Candidatus Eremiobacteraeota bacterium]